MEDPISWWRTTFGEDEIEKIRESILAEHISQGPVTAEFEQQLASALDVPYVVATTSGSTALLMGLMAAGVGPGDEVIVPNRTFIATAHAALLLGARVVLVDVLEEEPSMDVAQVESKITERTKAIMPVHLNGRSVDMSALREVASRHGIWIVEDACQAMFSRDEHGYIGTKSEVGCFSLGVTKLISTGQGGFVVTSDKDTYEALKLMRIHGVPDTFEGTYSRIGFNFRMTDITASIGLVQLNQVETRMKHVKAIQARYSAALHEMPFIDIIPVNEEAGEMPVWVEAVSDERDRLLSYLESRNIFARPFIPDLDQSPHLGVTGEFPRSKVFAAEGLYLPGGPAQPLENVDRVITALSDYGETR
jgi:perosamine synthetase